MSKSEKRLRFAIVGCGRIAQRHAEHIHRLGNLVAACDIEINKAHVLADKYDAIPCSGLEEMLEATGINVISVYSPNRLHAEHPIRSLRANCHLLCEKPMALSAKDCGAMIQEAERASRRIFVVKQNRFNPPVAAVKQLIDQGKLGNISTVQLNCFWVQKYLL